MEKPYTGLTALVQIDGVKIGYINDVELNLEKEIAEISQFGADYKEKVPAIKNWTASSGGTAAFAAGDSQEKLYQAYESGEEVTLTIKLNNAVYFQGNALVSSLSISGSPEDAMSISVEFEGTTDSDGHGVIFNLPETVNVKISSGVGGYTEPAGNIKVAKGTTLAVVCHPSAGKTADKYGLNGVTPATTITNNTFTTSALNADTTIYVTYKNA